LVSGEGLWVDVGGGEVTVAAVRARCGELSTKGPNLPKDIKLPKGISHYVQSFNFSPLPFDSISHSNYLSLSFARGHSVSRFPFSFRLFVHPSARVYIYIYTHTPRISCFPPVDKDKVHCFTRENILEVLSHPTYRAALVSIVSISTPLRPTPTKTPATFNHCLGVYIYIILYPYTYISAHNETPESRTFAWTRPAASNNFYCPRWIRQTKLCNGLTALQVHNEFPCYYIIYYYKL